MPRYVKDPWAKKSKKGMKLLGDMTKTAIKIGAVAYNESKKSQKRKTSSRSSYSTYSLPNSMPSSVPSQVDNTSNTGVGCVVVFLAIVFGIIILVSTEASAAGIAGFAILLAVSVAIAALASQSSEKEENKLTEKPTRTPQYIPSEQFVKGISDEILGEQDFSGIDLSNLTQSEKRVTLRAAFSKAVNTIKDQGLLIPDAEKRMNTFADYYSLNENDLQGGAFKTMAKLLIINDLLEGRLPKRFHINGAMPINFQSGESLIWAETTAYYYEERVHRSTVGRTAGLSIKIASGLYYRTGAFKGDPVITREMTFVDSGAMYVTDKNIYFQSARKAFRIPYNKIIGYVSYEDGIGIQKDGVSVKPMVIKGIDGWLVYNIVTNVNNIGKVKPQAQTSEASVKKIDAETKTGKRAKVDSKSLPEPYVIGNLVSEKKYDEAITLGEKLLKERPDSALVHVNLMDAYFKIREQDSINLLKSTLHAKMAMMCGHNTGYVQHRLVVNLESMWLIENAIQVCEIVQNPSFHFSKHGAGTKDEYAQRLERLQKKVQKSKPVDETLYFSESDIAQTFKKIKLNDEEEARQAEESQRRIRELEAELKNMMK